jgi:hypothetical protein
VIVYEGPSAIDGKPIVCILTGFAGTSNPKTGQMIQSWILRQDIDPISATRNGEDSSICGDCVHRRDLTTGKRSCYVNLLGPNGVYKAYKRGRYKKNLSLALRRLRGRPLRLGSYGDPAMLPLDLWKRLCDNAKQWTGYTHQWKWCNPDFSQYCMASVESDMEQAEAEALGYRCFRVTHSGDPQIRGQIVCPASDEGGKRTTCDQCHLCQGNMSERSVRVPHVQITVHGVGASAFNKRGGSLKNHVSL